MSILSSSGGVVSLRESIALKQEKTEAGKGLVFIISAPSGAGKTTLVRRVMAKVPGLEFSVSYTTRPPRRSERDGEDYHFISSSAFEDMVKEDQFLEWAEVLGNRYGTVRVNLTSLKAEGNDLVLDIDTQGARKVKGKVKEAVLIYILPPSLQELQERLERRGLDSPEMIRFRVASARKDMEEAHWYDYLIVNDRVEDAAEKLRSIIVAERCRSSKEAELILET